MNYDTTMNTVGGDLLAQGTICQPADNLLGAMNPYKTAAAATPLATAEAANPTSSVFIAAATAYATAEGGGALAPTDDGYAAALGPHFPAAVGARVVEMINACKPTDPDPAPCANPAGCGVNADPDVMPWCKYDFLPDVEHSGSCALSNSYDMFADPDFPGLPMLLVAVPTWIMVLVFLIMECTSIKDSDAMELNATSAPDEGKDPEENAP